MKKIITIFAIIALAVSAAYAGSNPLRMKSGSLRELKSASGTITCSMDFSRTKGNRKPLEQYITEDYGSSMDVFERYQPEMLEWFIERWNDDIEEGPKGVEVPGSNYELRIVVKNLNLGAKTGWGGASISGYADFYRKGEEEPFAQVEILKMNGTVMGGAVPGFPGLKQVFSDLAEYLCDLVYHSK